MKILLITPHFSLRPDDETITNDLANAFAAEGHDVHVSFIDWGQREVITGPASLENGIEVLVTAPVVVPRFGLLAQRIIKWGFSSIKAAIELRKWNSNTHYDLVVGFSPTSATLFTLLVALWRARSSYYVLWDFFPFHYRSIGLLANPVVFKFAHLLETWMMRRFDVIGCMSPANIAYLRKKYRLRAGQKVELRPIWGQTTAPASVDRNEMRRRYDLPLDKKIAVFGGQLTDGRGIEDILIAAELESTQRSKIAYLIIGDGRLANLVRDAAARSGSSLIYRPRIPRDDYLKLLTALDIALVCTVRNVDVPTFPSKTIDYLRAGLPIVASVEATTDYGSFIEREALGVSCLAGDGTGLANAVERASVALFDKANARRALYTFDASRAATGIVSAIKA